MPLYAGGKDLYGLRKSAPDLSAKMEKLDKAMRDVEAKVRNAWQDLITDETNSGFLRNSANISGEFLTLARKERKLGTRSLIDVLSEENSYITALDSAVSAETDLIISAFELLQEIGTLEVAMVQDQNSSASAADSSAAAAPLPEKSALLQTAAAAAAKHIAAQPEKSGEIDERQQAINEVQEDAEVIADSLNAVIRKMEGERGESSESVSSDTDTIVATLPKVTSLPEELKNIEVKTTYLPPSKAEQQSALDNQMEEYASQPAMVEDIPKEETGESNVARMADPVPSEYVPPTREQQQAGLDNQMSRYAPQFANGFQYVAVAGPVEKGDLSWAKAYKKMEEAGWVTVK